MNARDWFTARHVAAIFFVVIGGALQIYAVIDSGVSYMNEIGVGLLITGLVIELIGQGLGSRKERK